MTLAALALQAWGPELRFPHTYKKPSVILALGVHRGRWLVFISQRVWMNSWAPSSVRDCLKRKKKGGKWLKILTSGLITYTQIHTHKYVHTRMLWINVPREKLFSTKPSQCWLLRRTSLIMECLRCRSSTANYHFSWVILTPKRALPSPPLSPEIGPNTCD